MPPVLVSGGCGTTLCDVNHDSLGIDPISDVNVEWQNESKNQLDQGSYNRRMGHLSPCYVAHGVYIRLRETNRGRKHRHCHETVVERKGDLIP